MHLRFRATIRKDKNGNHFIFIPVDDKIENKLKETNVYEFIVDTTAIYKMR